MLAELVLENDIQQRRISPLGIGAATPPRHRQRESSIIGRECPTLVLLMQRHIHEW
jgi:hypothetical protein